MRLTGLTIVALACMLAAAASAQQPDEKPPAGRQAAAAPITVTGCLQRAEKAATPATGTTGALRVPEDAFVLINATAEEQGPQPADVTTYILTGGSDLASLVGERVEVTGIVSSAAGTAGTDAPAPAEKHEAGNRAGEPPATGTSAAPLASKVSSLRMTSIRSVTGDCSSSVITNPE